MGLQVDQGTLAAGEIGLVPNVADALQLLGFGCGPGEVEFGGLVADVEIGNIDAWMIACPGCGPDAWMAGLWESGLEVEMTL